MSDMAGKLIDRDASLNRQAQVCAGLFDAIEEFLQVYDLEALEAEVEYVLDHLPEDVIRRAGGV